VIRDNHDPATPLVSYLGWHGNRNIGDDAIYEAVSAQLTGATLLDLPRQPAEWMQAAISGRGRALRRSVFMVGGGTVVGRRHWRYMSTYGMSVSKKMGGNAIGVGVEDPVFQGRRSGSGRNELSRWRPLLSSMSTVSVRGPRSAELLADIGYDAEVSGDPALLLPEPGVQSEDGLIGLNIGFGDDLWGHDPGALAAELASAVAQLRTRGHRMVGILMNEEDRRWTQTALGNNAEIVSPVDTTSAAYELGRCSLVIATRLHAGILAALSGTPVLTLEYQPKCRDFALSIDDEGSLLRTDAVTASVVVDRVTDMLSDATSVRRRKLAAVAILRDRLRSDYETVRGQLGIVA
jgi:polysaccharide pyruvyl transferase WcaK-like protein